MINLTLDLHLHGEFSGGTSDRYPPALIGYVQQAVIQGIDIIGSGDCLHRRWLPKVKAATTYDKARGLLFMKAYPSISIMLTTEINCRWGMGKQAHMLLTFPTDSALLNKAIEFIEANGRNDDGRPDVLLSPKELHEAMSTLSPDILFIPAHVLTPWFGILGSKVGYASVAEAFDGFVPDALETGLSADTDMLEQLTDLPLVSFSDAHSTKNLGREVTCMSVKEVSYDEIVRHIRQGECGTIEHPPGLGKYYWTGCKKCGWQMEGDNDNL